MTDAGAQKALWDVRKAGLNIMMSMKGDGKPVSFIEDCAVPLEHLADYVDAADRGVRASTARAAPGTRTRRSARCTCGRSSTCAATARRRCARSPRRPRAMVREYKGAFSGEHGDGLVRSEWVAWQFGPRLTRAFEEIKALFDPGRPDEPRQDRAAARRWTTRALFRFRPATATLPLDTALDWSAWNVQSDPVTEHADARRAPAAIRRGGFAKAVEMCNNNGHCRKFDAGTMCPSYPRHARRGAPDARPRQHAAARAVGPARRRRSPPRRCARRSTCASAARAASATARPASTWRR